MNTKMVTRKHLLVLPKRKINHETFIQKKNQVYTSPYVDILIRKLTEQKTYIYIVTVENRFHRGNQVPVLSFIE